MRRFRIKVVPGRPGHRRHLALRSSARNHHVPRPVTRQLSSPATASARSSRRRRSDPDRAAAPAPAHTTAPGRIEAVGARPGHPLGVHRRRRAADSVRLAGAAPAADAGPARPRLRGHAAGAGRRDSARARRPRLSSRAPRPAPGKTLAFALPILQRCSPSSRRFGDPSREALHARADPRADARAGRADRGRAGRAHLSLAGVDGAGASAACRWIRRSAPSRRASTSSSRRRAG